MARRVNMQRLRGQPVAWWRRWWVWPILGCASLPAVILILSVLLATFVPTKGCGGPSILEQNELAIKSLLNERLLPKETAAFARLWHPDPVRIEGDSISIRVDVVTEPTSTDGTLGMWAMCELLCLQTVGLLKELGIDPVEESLSISVEPMCMIGVHNARSYGFVYWMSVAGQTQMRTKRWRFSVVDARP